MAISNQNYHFQLKSTNDPNAKQKLGCTNLNFYHHLVESVFHYQKAHKIISIFDDRKKHVGSDADDSKFRIDILCECFESRQQFWVKIIARSSSGISDEVAGNCSYGTKNIIDVAYEYLAIAQHFYTPCFKPPRIIFDFLHRINNELETQLEDMGIIIGKKYRHGQVDLSESLNDDTDSLLNVDITSMLAYVSELSNGGCNATFESQILNEQAAEERKNPVKRFLDKTFEGKHLIACETAVNSFKAIIETLAGEKEQKRAEELLSRIEVLPDIENPEEIINVEDSHRVKERSRKIFAFGIFHRALTVTSNRGFARAVKYLNLDIPTVFHSPRALSEGKPGE